MYYTLAMNQKVILVVCRGNIARSPVAEFFINSEIKKRSLDSKIMVISRGTQGTLVDPQPVKFSNISFYDDLYAEAKPALDALKVDLSAHVSKPVTREDVNMASVILAVDQKTKNALLQLFPDMNQKVHMLTELTGNTEDFPDPENLNGKEKHLKIFTEIKEVITNGFEKLISLTGI